MAADDEGKPPFFPSWRAAYAFVLAWLVVTVIALSVLSRVEQ
jgi:hypothetical protein